MNIQEFNKLTKEFERFRPNSDSRNNTQMIKNHILNIKKIILEENRESQDWIIRTIINNYLRFKNFKERKDVMVFAKKLNIYVKIDYPIFKINTYKQVAEKLAFQNKINLHINLLLKNQLKYTLGT